MKIVVFLFMICIIFNKAIYAQDIHWSQPTNALIYQNPAFTGINNKFSTNANYKNQWNAVNTSYNSYMITGDYRFGKNTPGNSSFSMGGIIHNDISGEGNYRTTGGGLTFSSLIKTGKKISLGMGIGYNVVQNSLQINNYSWSSQFDGQNYNSSLSSGEDHLRMNKIYSDINTGISMVYNENTSSTSSNSDTKLIFGYSINHLNRPDIALNGSVDKLQMKHTVFMNGIIKLKENLALKPTLLVYFQGTLSEITFGSLVRYAIQQQSKITGYKKGSAVSFGALYRVNDAIIPTAEFEKGNLIFGISYDVNVSSLSPTSRLRGGLEFSVRFVDIGNYLYKNKQK